MNIKLFILASLLFLSGFILKTTKERVADSRYLTFFDVRFKVGQRMEIKVNYDFDKSGIRPESKKLLDSVYIFMILHPELTFEISNHTDSRGNDKFNLKLSERRDEMVREYLLFKGIPNDRITVRGAGETEPLFTDEQIKKNGITKESIERYHQSNRRTVLTISGLTYQYPEGTKNFTVGNFILFNKENIKLLFGNSPVYEQPTEFSKAIFTYRFNESILTSDNPYQNNDKKFVFYSTEVCYYNSLVILSKLPNTEPKLIDSKENREVYQYDSCSDKWTKLDI